MTANPPDPNYPYLQPGLKPEVVDLPVQPGSRSTSVVRTVVPVLWGLLLTFLATRFPAVHAFVVLQEPHLYVVLEAAVTALWYVLFRFAENHLPAWLTALVLGSNRQPVYVEPLPVAQSARREVA